MSDLSSGRPGRARPVLYLKIRPASEPVEGSGRVNILEEYESRRLNLVARVEELVSLTSERTRWFGGYCLLHVEMDPRCWAPSWTPDNLFSAGTRGTLVAPWYGGYLVQIPLSARSALLRALNSPTSEKQKQNISMIAELRPVHEVRGSAEAETAWRDRRQKGAGLPLFIASLAPFQVRAAREEVVTRLRDVLAGRGLIGRLPEGIAPPPPNLPAPSAPRDLTRENGMAPYLQGRANRILLTAAGLEDLLSASASGTIVRWDPVNPLAPTAPGLGPAPTGMPNVGAETPVVGVIDGGLNSARYEDAVAWRAAPFIEERMLDTIHGNCIAGLIVDGHLWNNRLSLPPMFCRLGIAPAVPGDNFVGEWDHNALLSYIDRVIAEHSDTKVWNISANLEHACDPERVSELGNALNVIARRRNVLLVISAGNRGNDGFDNIAPPADSNAAITVSGRLHDIVGGVGEACPVSRTGRGPEDMIKPELSWFSVQRVSSGGYGHASSWAAPLVSRLAAHTWEHLQTPTPDLVKALLINAADHEEYRRSTGFGSPVRPVIPWESSSDKAIVAWTAEMKEKLDYMWDGIKIPNSLILPGARLMGRVRLVAILEPETQMIGTNYFSTRLQTSIRYKNARGKWDRLVGSLKTEEEEIRARTFDDKWQPLRCNTRRCTDLGLGGGELRVHARLFWRDRYCHNVDFETYTAKVTFVVSIGSLDRRQAVYDEFVDLMGSNVEIGVVTTTETPAT